MMNVFRELINPDNFMPHGHCYYWDPTILWSHAVSDGIIALAYILIPMVLIKVFQKRKNTQYVWLMALFALFIAGCGITHIMDVVTIWEPAYRLDSVFRCITAVASIGTAVALVRLAPRLLSIPTAHEWQQTIAQQDATNQQLIEANQALQHLTEELSEQKHFIEQVLSLIPNSIYIFDMNQFRTVYTNREITQTLGYSEEEIYSYNHTTIHELVHPDDLAKRAQYYHDFVTATDGEARQTDIRIRHADGDYRHFIIRNVIFHRTPEGTPDQILGIALDITDQQQLASRLQEFNHSLKEKSDELATANEELQSANEELIAANEELTTISDHLKAANLENERLAAETIRISEQRYLELTDSMQEIFVVLDHDLRYAFANKAAEQFFNQSRENIYGKTPQEVLGPEIGKDLEAIHRKVMETGQSQTDVEQHLLGGQRMYLERTSYPTSMGGVFVIRRNITASMHAEQRFRDLAESITDIFFALDNELRYTYYNRASEQFTGRQASEVLGKHLFDVIPSLKGGILEKAFQKVIQTQQPDSLLYQHIHHNQLYYFMLHIYVTETGIAIIGRNETERIRLTQKLEEEKQRLELALQNGELGLWDWDLTTNEVYLNERWALLLDYEPHEIKHNVHNWLEKIHPEDMPRVSQQLESHLHNQSPVYQTEYRLKSKNGAWKWVMDSGKVISRDEQGKALRVTGIVMDITKKKQYEDKINKLNEELETKVQERTAELTAVNNELEAFSYAVSHDLQAPLRSIGGFSKVLLEDYSAILDANGRENLEIIQQATQRMRDIIQALLKLSKVTRMPLHKELVDVSQQARQLLNELQKAEKDRKVVYEVADGLTAYADVSLFRIVLQNLLGNAWKYTSRKEEAKIVLGKTQTDQGEAFFIADNGAGFDMKYAKKLFSAFQRLHSEKDFEGTGIGLATVHRILTKHGGHIWAESTINEGTTFYFNVSNGAQ